jgi:hypothetical protein
MLLVDAVKGVFCRLSVFKFFSIIFLFSYRVNVKSEIVKILLE